MAKNNPALDIPAAWHRLPVERMQGTLLVVGAVDTGKSTLARFLLDALQAGGRRAALLDGDPGQSTFGPPATMTLAEQSDPARALQPGASPPRYFAGSITPQGHMLPVVVGAARLAAHAFQSGVETLVYDTSGLVDAGAGGVALKQAKIDLLRPSFVIALQHQQELEPLLLALRRSGRVPVIDLRPSEAVVRRGPEQRREHRIRQFARYFHGAAPLTFDWSRIAVFPLPLFLLHRLVALEDNQGFTLGLGIVTAIDRAKRQATLFAPGVKLSQVNALRLGDLLVDPATFHHERLTG